MRMEPPKDCHQLGLINALKVIVQLLTLSKTLENHTMHCKIA